MYIRLPPPISAPDVSTPILPLLEGGSRGLSKSIPLIRMLPPVLIVRTPVLPPKLSALPPIIHPTKLPTLPPELPTLSAKLPALPPELAILPPVLPNLFVGVPIGVEGVWRAAVGVVGSEGLRGAAVGVVREGVVGVVAARRLAVGGLFYVEVL